MSFEWKNKRVLITGGAGFIGSYLTELIVQEAATVTVVDDLSRGQLGHLARVINDIRFVQADLRYLDACEGVCSGQDVVLNLAAPVFGLEYSVRHHGEMLTSSLMISSNVLEAARRKGVSRCLVCSSSCVYPDDALVPTPESEAERGSPESANRGYGWAKRIAEAQAQYYAEEYGMEIAIGRPFNAYGPRDYIEGEKAHVIPALIQKALTAAEPIRVWGSGNQTRSFVHARDIALGLKLITERYACADPVNIGHDEETTIRDLITRICRLAAKPCEVVFDTSKPEGAGRKAADTTKLRAVTLGFVPSVTLDQGLEEMLDSFTARMSASGELSCVGKKVRAGG